ncbi:MAG: DUF4382 domain-containing protein [Chitinophagaceae bacterium]|uniref:DUF4382 domain-containing protein n=1 Tax=unclassified Paraflavitalea TaxID=2798305 RepID=UPI003D3362DE|nr:DUF4382 domain-containing protein [Chitinophagaceae bacterium]
MKTKMKVLSLAAVVTLFALSCQKGAGNQSGNASLKVYLTDGPGSFDAVNIEVLAVEAKIDTCQGSKHDDRHGLNDFDKDDINRRDSFGVWQTLTINPGIYNVLSLKNGIDTLLASGTIDGTVRKLRIQLGTNNTVVKDSITYPLTIVNETNNYLYVHLQDKHRHDSSSTVGVWVDFDIARSIVEINGKYYLKPVLRPFCDKNFASLVGSVLPSAAAATVIAYGPDTATAIPNADGRFKIRGLTAGTYRIVFDGSNGYNDTTITSVSIQNGRETKLPAVVLHQ